MKFLFIYKKYLFIKWTRLHPAPLKRVNKHQCYAQLKCLIKIFNFIEVSNFIQLILPLFLPLSLSMHLLSKFHSLQSCPTFNLVVMINKMTGRVRAAILRVTQQWVSIICYYDIIILWWYANEQSSGFEVAGNVRNGNGIPICDRLIKMVHRPSAQLWRTTEGPECLRGTWRPSESFSQRVSIESVSLL